jgi:hypothetical protein
MLSACNSLHLTVRAVSLRRKQVARYANPAATELWTRDRRLRALVRACFQYSCGKLQSKLCGRTAIADRARPITPH